jgi:hypothetical protein
MVDQNDLMYRFADGLLPPLRKKMLAGKLKSMDETLAKAVRLQVQEDAFAKEKSSSILRGVAAVTDGAMHQTVAQDQNYEELMAKIDGLTAAVERGQIAKSSAPVIKSSQTGTGAMTSAPNDTLVPTTSAVDKRNLEI